MRRSRPVAVAVTAILLGLFLVLFVYASRVPVSSTARPPPDNARAIADGEAVARASVKDPESAKFRGSFISKTSQVPMTCGEIDYRNAAGDYAGFQRFIAVGPVAQLEEETGRENFRRLWSAMCNRDE